MEDDHEVDGADAVPVHVADGQAARGRVGGLGVLVQLAPVVDQVRFVRLAALVLVRNWRSSER